MNQVLTTKSAPIADKNNTKYAHLYKGLASLPSLKTNPFPAPAGSIRKILPTKRRQKIILQHSIQSSRNIVAHENSLDFTSKRVLCGYGRQASDNRFPPFINVEDNKEINLFI